MLWECQACIYLYDPKNGDKISGILEGTQFSDLPDGWTCPVCGVGTEFFEEISGGEK